MAVVSTSLFAPYFGEQAGIDNARDITRGYVTSLLTTQDPLLSTKGGYDLQLYEKVRADYQVKDCMDQRIAAIISADYEVIPGDKSRKAKKAAQYVEDLLKSIPFDKICEEMMWGRFYGFSLGELMLSQMPDGLVGLDVKRGGIRVRNRRRFRFNPEMQPMLLTYQNITEGELMHWSRVWAFNCGADNSDEPDGRGLAFWLYWMVFFKRGGFHHWADSLERFSKPATGITVPEGSSDTTIEEAKMVATDIQGGGVFAITRDWAIDMLEANRSGTADYSALIDKTDAAISKIIVGQTMTTDNGSSYAQANVHKSVADWVVKMDADLICGSFNKEVLADRLIPWNFGEDCPVPQVWRKVDAVEDLNARVDRDTKVQGLGWKLKADSVPEIYGDEYEPVNTDVTVSLDDAKITALNQLIKDATADAIPVESAKQLMVSTFSIPEAIAAKIVKPILDKQKEDKANQAPNPFAQQPPGQQPPGQQPPGQQPPGQQPPQPQFADFYELGEKKKEYAVKPAAPAVKKKNCTKGVFCVGKTGKGSCVHGKCKQAVSATTAAYAGALTPAQKGAATKAKNKAAKEAAALATATPATTTTALPAPATKPGQPKIRQESLDNIRANLVSSFGEKLVADAESNMQRIVNESDIFIRVPGDAIVSKIIKSGRMKSSFESGGKGSEYNKTRASTEDALFGYARDTAKTERPIYGYMASKKFDMKTPEQQGVDSYGNVAMRLKPEAKQRASIAGHDSWVCGMPSAATNVNGATFAEVRDYKGVDLKESMKTSYLQDKMKNGLKNAAAATDVSDFMHRAQSPFIETQVHQGVKTSDIAELIYTKGEKPSKSVISWAKKNGVKITEVTG